MLQGQGQQALQEKDSKLGDASSGSGNRIVTSELYTTP